MSLRVDSGRLSSPRARNSTKRGRPRGTSARTLEVIALRLFTEQGFEETTVEQIASAAGVSRRTFFRYFDSKTDVLWQNFDNEVGELRRVLASVPNRTPVMQAIREAVVTVNRYAAEDASELRARMSLISGTPALAASTTAHYDAWEQAVIDFAAHTSQRQFNGVAARCHRPRDPRRLPGRVRALGASR